MSLEPLGILRAARFEDESKAKRNLSTESKIEIKGPAMVLNGHRLLAVESMVDAFRLPEVISDETYYRLLNASIGF